MSNHVCALNYEFVVAEYLCKSSLPSTCIAKHHDDVDFQHWPFLTRSLRLWLLAASMSEWREALPDKLLGIGKISRSLNVLMGLRKKFLAPLQCCRTTFFIKETWPLVAHLVFFCKVLVLHVLSWLVITLWYSKWFIRSIESASGHDIAWILTLNTAWSSRQSWRLSRWESQQCQERLCWMTWMRCLKQDPS